MAVSTKEPANDLPAWMRGKDSAVSTKEPAECARGDFTAWELIHQLVVAV